MKYDFINSIKVDSWELISDANIAIKHCDKSFFVSNETGIPKKYICEFFGIDYTFNRKEIILRYDNINYDATIFVREKCLNRATMFWKKPLSILFSRFQSDNMIVCFKKIDNDIFDLQIISDIDNDYQFIDEYNDGKSYYCKTIEYERNPENRKRAIIIHGLTCQACGFNFEKFYGELGKNYIEVHHLVPLYIKGNTHLIDPSKDLVCLCSNCHRMIHRIYREDMNGTVEKLQKIITENKNSK